MEIRLLEDFLALTEEMTFSAAAERRNMTQPAFSRRIQSLEAWLGAPLFRRTSRSVVLTAAGQLFLPRAAAIVRDVKRAREEVREQAGKSDRSIAIAATQALSFTFVPRWMLQTIDSASFGSINLISDSYEECEALLLRGEAVFLISHRRLEVRSRISTVQFTSSIIGKDVLIPLAQPDNDNGSRWRLSFESSEAPMPYLAYASPSGLGRILDSYWAGLGQRPNLRTAFRSRLATTLLEMARGGQGIAWIPLSLAERELGAGRLSRAGGSEFDVPVDIVLVRPAATLSRHAERFWQRVTPTEQKQE